MKNNKSTVKVLRKSEEQLSCKNTFALTIFYFLYLESGNLVMSITLVGFNKYHGQTIRTELKYLLTYVLKSVPKNWVREYWSVFAFVRP